MKVIGDPLGLQWGSVPWQHTLWLRDSPEDLLARTLKQPELLVPFGEAGPCKRVGFGEACGHFRCQSP